jgi:hypothetical protein
MFFYELCAVRGGGDAPLHLLFHRDAAAIVVGLAEIVIPGSFVACMLRYDVQVRLAGCLCTCACACVRVHVRARVCACAHDLGCPTRACSHARTHTRALTQNSFRTRYFHSCFFGYVLGLCTTFLMTYLNVRRERETGRKVCQWYAHGLQRPAPVECISVAQAAQPALLFIVPGILGCTALHAYMAGEFKKVGVIGRRACRAEGVARVGQRDAIPCVPRACLFDEAATHVRGLATGVRLPGLSTRLVSRRGQ